jgi:hypothetical protein
MLSTPGRLLTSPTLPNNGNLPSIDGISPDLIGYIPSN